MQMRQFVWLPVRLAAIILLFLGAVYAFQGHLLYYPEKVALSQYAAPADLKPWPGSEDLRGLTSKPAGRARAIAVVFHGNAGHAGHRKWYADNLVRLDLPVILAEYPGYGPRPGSPSEKSLVADAAQILALVRQSTDLPILVIGESLGAGVAVGAVRADPGGVAGLMLITPWDTLENVARHHYPFLPVSWLLRDRYDSRAGLRMFPGRVLVAIAERDSIVPARFGRALYESFPLGKRLVTWPETDHNDWPGIVDGQWWASSIEFLLADGKH
jgi:hypothetical protein